jgi:hypothetical protein
MSTKKSSRKQISDKPEEKEVNMDEELEALAKLLFHPENKNPYYLNDKALNNLKDLVDNLNSFTGNEGRWVAAWLEYLGDEDLAARIQNWPEDFKQLVIARYNKLKGYHICNLCEPSS